MDIFWEFFAFQEHGTLHTGVKPHRCPICGREIRVNDNIVWPVQFGHSISMRRGQVAKINATGSLAVRTADSDALVSIRKVENVVVLA